MSKITKVYTHYSNLLEEAGEIFALMNLITYNGKALTATMTATFQTKRTDMTNERSLENRRVRGDSYSWGD